MQPITRRAFVAGAGAVVSLISTRARAAEFEWKLGHSHPPTYPSHVRLSEAAKKIEAETGGRVVISIFPSNQLGGDSDLLSQVRSGALEMNFTSGPNLGALVPLASISGIAFAFNESPKAWAAMDGALGDMIRARLQKAGLTVMAPTLELGLRQISSGSKPIRAPEDLKGFKIRVPPSPLYTSVFTALGASPATLNFNELYTALETGIVSGQENPLTLFESARLYEVQKYCSLTNHIWDGLWLYGNSRVMAQLPPDLQMIVSRNLAEAVRLQRDDMERLRTEARTRLEAHKIAFNTTEPEVFRAALRKAGFYADWKQKFSAEEWKALETAAGAEM